MAKNDTAPKATQDDPLRPVRPTKARETRWEQGDEARWAELPHLADYTPTEAREEEPASKKQLKELAWDGFELLRPLKWGEARHLIRQCRRLKVVYGAIPSPKVEAELRRHGRWRDGMTMEEVGVERWALAHEAFAKAAREYDARCGSTKPKS